MSDKKGIFWCGTSNVEVPARNKAEFPEAFRSKSHLEYYSSLFNSVEINRTFYKLPLPATLAKWAAQVPEDFRFSVKLWREITHVKELRYKKEDVKTFLETVGPIGGTVAPIKTAAAVGETVAPIGHTAAPVGGKKGCLLIQFPAGLDSRSVGSLERLLADISNMDAPPGWRMAVEFRNRGWYVPAVRELLDRYRAGWVLHDMPMKGASPGDETGGNRGVAGPIRQIPGGCDGDFIFLRYHGPRGDYRGSYAPEFLEKEAVAIKGWLEQGKHVYTYFNNTAEGDAPKDALMLRGFVEQV